MLMPFCWTFWLAWFTWWLIEFGFSILLIFSLTYMIFSVRLYFSIKLSFISSDNIAFACTNFIVYVLKLIFVSLELKYYTSGILNSGMGREFEFWFGWELSCRTLPCRTFPWCSKNISPNDYSWMTSHKKLDYKSAFVLPLYIAYLPI